MGIIDSRRQILSLLTYLTATLLRYDLTLSHIYNPSWIQVLMVVKVIFWRGSNSTCCFNFTIIEQDSAKKHVLKLNDVTNNDVLGFDSRLLFLSADIIAPILTNFNNVSIETQNVISDWKLSKVTPIYK